MRCLDHLVVGIFSREESSTYEGLIRKLTCTCGVKDVRPVLITNTWRDFEKGVPNCSFGILYHSQSRGRLNIVNVTDSLYDEELKYLANRYGRENVLVVIGDMEDTSDEKKASILKEQSIGNYARDLFLFNAIKDGKAPFQGSKIKDLQNIIKGITCRQLFKKYLIWLIFLVVVLIIIIIAVSVRTSNHPPPPSTLTPPINVTNATSHFTSNMTTTPLSTIAKLTSSFTSQMTNATTQLPANITSVGNATSHFTSNMTTTPLSTIAKTTSSFTSQMTNATTQLPANIPSVGNATKLP